MAKGFSFVLVTVVMILMLVFGMLSLSSAGADLRLSQKAGAAQQTYYDLDSGGEALRGACAQAAARAQEQADAFMAGGLYHTALPADFYPCLQALTARAAPGNAEYTKLARGVFFYELEKQLAPVGKEYSVSYNVDQNALAAALAGASSDAPVATVYSAIKSAKQPRDSLNVTLVCPFGAQGSPAFRVTQWQFSVSAPPAGSSSAVRVWGG